jgi:hypothetical protein
MKKNILTSLFVFLLVVGFAQAVFAQACGNGKCQKNESCSSCPQDCGACPPVCGDGTCNGTETCSTCAQDCGPCGGGNWDDISVLKTDNIDWQVLVNSDGTIKTN